MICVFPWTSNKEVVYLARNVPWLRKGRNPKLVIQQFDVIDEEMKKNDELSSVELQRILLACCNITVSAWTTSSQRNTLSRSQWNGLSCSQWNALSRSQWNVFLLRTRELQLQRNFGVPLAFPQRSSNAFSVRLLLSGTVATCGIGMDIIWNHPI